MASKSVRSGLKKAGIGFGSAGKSEGGRLDKKATGGIKSGTIETPGGLARQNMRAQSRRITSAAFGSYDNPQGIGTGGNRPKSINTNSTRIRDYKRYSYTGMAKPVLDRAPTR